MDIKTLAALLMTGLALALPASAADGEKSAPEALHNQFDDQFDAHDGVHESLREHLAAFKERLRNADLRPAEKRRIYNAFLEKLQNRHDAAHVRLRRANDKDRDRPSDVRRDVRRDVPTDIRPDVGPDARRVDARPAARPEPVRSPARDLRRPAAPTRVSPRPAASGRAGR